MWSIPPAWASAIDEEVRQTLSESEQFQPPVRPLKIAQKLGYLVAYDHQQASRGRQKRLGGRTAILVKPDERGERVCWTVAHEIGEARAANIFRRLNMDEDEIRPTWREEVANRFASRLLLPTDWFLSDFEQTQGDLHELKQRYITASHEAIAWRMLDRPEPTIITIVDQGRLWARRGNFPSASSRLHVDEKEMWTRANVSSVTQRLDGSQWRIVAWAIHEHDWRREILCSIWSPNLVGTSPDEWESA